MNSTSPIIAEKGEMKKEPIANIPVHMTLKSNATLISNSACRIMTPNTPEDNSSAIIADMPSRVSIS